MIRILEKSETFDEVLNTDSLILVDFYADWCEPCKWLDKILDEINVRADFPLVLLKINTDNHPDLTQQFHLKSVPVLMIFKNGNLVWQMNGFLSLDELLNKIRSFHVKH